MSDELSIYKNLVQARIAFLLGKSLSEAAQITTTHSDVIDQYMRSGWGYTFAASALLIHEMGDRIDAINSQIAESPPDDFIDVN